ncbi:hypothetical protein SAMN04488104_102728 [Algoriphagus faecimaris]|uniref:Uncharacterized protein n=1 Tax=Algoriphagus faecimaris TaxID=686796 RepID=A0A1G6U9Y5_9BACT|nr:hypothetical protein [Algoriphagus faecimaris]SDD38200.1 hypothetical protein SAMN04488104_102728 [Algoriphagus faecimaris]
MNELSLVEYLGIGGFCLSLFSIGLTILLELRRTKGNLKVNIKSVTKTTGSARSYLNYEVEIVNGSLEKRYIKTVFEHNLLGRWVFLLKLKSDAKHRIKSWHIKESYEKYPCLERGEELILVYDIIYPNEEFSKMVYLKFLVVDSFGKKYKSKGISIIPSELEEKPSRGGLYRI